VCSSDLIDNKFLEWFVKNPSCEEVKYIFKYNSPYVYNSEGHLPDETSPKTIHIGYELKIPQEELTYTESAKKEERIFNSTMIKQETLEDVNDTIVPIKKVTIYELLKEYGKNLTKSEFKILNNKINIKQETLEEAAENYTIDSPQMSEIRKIAFIKGAKWQAEKMYSEEEVKEIIKLSCEEGMLIQRTINDKVKIPYTRIKDFTIKMFEQFKKK
jgi:hypothetical protein